MKKKDWDTLKSSPEYGLWRAETYRRDKWTCRICGSKKDIEAHHIYPLRSHFSKRFEKGNGITLCRKCHRTIYGKELQIAKNLKEIIKNGVNSGNILKKDNPERSLEGNLLERATTRERGYSIEQFVKKQVKCAGCGKLISRHYYRLQSSKTNKFFCSVECKQGFKFGPAWNKREPTKQKCLFCGKEMKPTPSQKHRKKKFCNNSCHSKWMWKNGRKPTKRLNGKWTIKYDKCKTCGTKEKRHYGKGLCMTCYNTQYNASKFSTKTLPERDDIV